LPNPPRDASAIAAALHDAGFDAVSVGENFNAKQMRAAVEYVRARAEESDIVLVYYAGHGLEVQSINFLLPTDTDADRQDFLEAQALRLDALASAASRARRGALIVADACRDDPISKARTVAASRSGGRPIRPAQLHSGLAPPAQSEPKLVTLFSTQSGQAALDGEDLESPFTRAFLNQLGQKGETLGVVVEQTRTAVANATSGRQVPAFYGDPAAIAAPLQPGAP